jgi:hypothetical protein
MADAPADQSLRINAGTTTLGGNLIGPNDFYIGSVGDPNAIQIAANGELTLTDVITGVIPTAGSHLATKEYVDLAVGTRDTFFLSDTGSGVGDLNYAYQHETTDDESTIVNDGGGEEYDVGTHLHKGFITEVGQPGTTILTSGVISLDFHAKKGHSNQKDTVIHAVLSYVDADGTTGKTTIATSAVSAELTDTEKIFHLHASMAEEVEIADTDRLILDVNVTVSGVGQNVVVTLYMEGVHDSHFQIGIAGGVWQNYGAVLDDLNTLGAATSDGQFIVATEAGVFTYEATTTARTSLGVGTGDSPQLTGIELGHADDTTLTRAAAGVVAIQGTNIAMAGDAPTAHTHDTDTLQLDGINSNDGAFAFDTTGIVTFNQGTKIEAASDSNSYVNLWITDTNTNHDGIARVLIQDGVRSISFEQVDSAFAGANSDAGDIREPTHAVLTCTTQLNVRSGTATKFYVGGDLATDEIGRFTTAGLNISGGTISATNYTAANLLTACATNAGALDFSAASKTLTVEDNTIVSQDYSTDGSVIFASATFNQVDDTNGVRIVGYDDVSGSYGDFFVADTGDVTFKATDANIVFSTITAGKKISLNSSDIVAVQGAITTGFAVITASADNTNVSRINTLFVDPGAAVTIGAFIGGVNGQVLHVVCLDNNQNITLEHNKGTGAQNIFLNGGDSTIASDFGGWTLVHLGGSWYESGH